MLLDHRDTEVRWARLLLLTLLAAALSLGNTFGGPEPLPDSKDITLEKREGPTVEIPTARESRGLITLEGPSGMFINPTSATLPQGTLILNYCIFVPSLPEGKDLIGHGILLSYGVRDWLEVGFTGDLLDFSVDEHLDRTQRGKKLVPATEDTFVIGGPEVRIRLLRDRSDKWWPELSIGSYLHLGTPDGLPVGPLNGYNAFIAASKTIPICEHGFLKTITFQGGFRTQWLTADIVHENTSERGYGGLEVQLPWNLYVIGEIVSRDDELDNTVDTKHNRFPWAAGIQWRGRRFGCTIAALQNGIEEGPGFYFGVGGGLGPEPVRTSTGVPGGVPGARP